MFHQKSTLLAAGLAAVTLSAHAAQETFQASVTVLDPITIVQNIPLSFGKIVAPNDGNPNTFSSGGGVSGSGNGSYVSGAQAAEVEISGTAGETADYSFAAGACTDANLSLAITTGNGTVALGPVSLVVEGELTAQSGTPAGSYTCDYTVTANYQ